MKRLLIVVLLALLLAGCTPDSTFLPVVCGLDGAKWNVSPGDDELYLYLELYGIECDD